MMTKMTKTKMHETLEKLKNSDCIPDIITPLGFIVELAYAKEVYDDLKNGTIKFVVVKVDDENHNSDEK